MVTLSLQLDRCTKEEELRVQPPSHGPLHCAAGLTASGWGPGSLRMCAPYRSKGQSKGPAASSRRMGGDLQVRLQNESNFLSDCISRCEVEYQSGDERETKKMLHV